MYRILQSMLISVFSRDSQELFEDAMQDCLSPQLPGKGAKMGVSVRLANPRAGAFAWYTHQGWWREWEDCRPSSPDFLVPVTKSDNKMACLWKWFINNTVLFKCNMLMVTEVFIVANTKYLRFQILQMLYTFNVKLTFLWELVKAIEDDDNWIQIKDKIRTLIP